MHLHHGQHSLVVVCGLEQHDEHSDNKGTHTDRLHFLPITIKLQLNHILRITITITSNYCQANYNYKIINYNYIYFFHICIFGNQNS